MNQLNDTELSGPHRHMLKLLREQNVAVVSEYKIVLGGKLYKLDCFLPDYLVAVEVDGPQHSRRKDTERDSALSKVGVVTLRVTSTIIKMDFAVLAGLEESLPGRREKWAKRKDFE